MTNRSAEFAQGDGDASLLSLNPQPGQPERLVSHRSNDNKIFKCGPLFLSSKGIGWTSWKKRWFILTQTSLVFFRSDPSVVSQKGNEVNLTLGGIDLNNSGSVVIKAEKRLLTVQFPDVHDGRAFTLKAETIEDLYEWKIALEDALAQAPGTANVKGQKGIFSSDQTDSLDLPLDQLKDRDAVKYRVIGRPILLALEEADGTPSFLEKALRFIEEHGVKVEGILRQAADVDDVENRVREYELGEVEFSNKEDAHVIGDCIKLVLRELPSSPVPASCCKALLEAFRTSPANRVFTMRSAIYDTFPEPNCRLLRRILLMMQTVASHKAENRMSTSAVAACMAPLLLRPLLAGECEIENDFDVGGDGSLQLLQAAAAANHAQAIVVTLLEEYNNIFGENSVSPGPDMYMDSEDSGSESEDATDDDFSYDDDDYDDEDESIQESDVDVDDDVISETNSESEDSVEIDQYDQKDHDLSNSCSNSSEVSVNLEVDQLLSTSLDASLPQPGDIKSCQNITSPINSACADESNIRADIVEGFSTGKTTIHNSCPCPSLCVKKSTTISNGPAHGLGTVYARNSATKNLSMESIDYLDVEAEIERLESVKAELQMQIAEEVKINAKLQYDIETRKKALKDRHLTLERNVARLREQLLKEKSSRVTLDAGPKFPPGSMSDLSDIDDKTKADLEEILLMEVDLTNIERKVVEFEERLNVQLKQNHGSSKHKRNLKNNPNTEVAATSESDMSISKQDTHFGGAENERKPELAPLPNNHPPSSKKSGTRGEGANSTSALTKLTSRLNFLKEHRSQISNEPQNMMDKGQDLSHSMKNLKKGKGSELHLSLPRHNKSRGYQLSLVSPNKPRGFESPQLSPNKPRGYEYYIPFLSPRRSRSENHSPTNPDKGRGFGNSKSPQTSERSPGKEGQPLQHSDKMRKSESLPGHIA